MTIQYYLGGKIVGLEADTKPTSVPANTTFIESDTFSEFIFDGVATWNPIGVPVLPIGGWTEVGRTTLGASASTITISSLPNKRYYKILYADKSLSSTGADIFLRLNGDTAANYAIRRNKDGDTDQTGVNQTLAFVYAGNTVQTPNFLVLYLSNLSSQEKLFMNHGMSQLAAGAGTPPQRVEMAGKWTNTSNAVSSITFLPSSGTFASGSEVVVLGWDPADTHTDNFWEELGSAELLIAGDDLDITSFSAKKYLWLQSYIIPTGTVDIDLTFNADSGPNYATRGSFNGGSDFTFANAANIEIAGSTTTPTFTNTFIINNLANEKLVINNQIRGGTAGAANAPDRVEQVGKWDVTSSQINRIDLNNDKAGSYDIGSFLKLWGHD